MKLNTPHGTPASAKHDPAPPLGLDMMNLLQNFVNGPAMDELQNSLRVLAGYQELQRVAAINGMDALTRLVLVMKKRTGQGFKLRRLLYSLWSGTPCGDLSDVLCLDWPVRVDFCRVLLGWGCEGKHIAFFYDYMETLFRDANLLDWFREEGDDK